MAKAYSIKETESLNNILGYDELSPKEFIELIIKTYDIRIEKGIDKGAELLGIARKTVDNWYRGYRKPPDYIYYWCAEVAKKQNLN
jgi:hypothetical protein